MPGPLPPLTKSCARVACQALLPLLDTMRQAPHLSISL
jgi:hypothetical protein